MNIQNRSLRLLGFWVLFVAIQSPSLVLGQDSPVPHDCHAPSTQLQANKQVALKFFRPGVTLREIFSLLDPGYVQPQQTAKIFNVQRVGSGEYALRA